MERRRAPRLPTNLWVGLPEVDGAPQLSKCSISVSGVLVQSRRDAGAPGVVRMLHLGRVGSDAMVEIMAHVVRVIACDDVKLGRVIEATAFEFLAEGNEQLRQIVEFVGQVAETEMASEPAAALDFSFPAQLTDSHDSAGAATVRALGVSGMIIEAPWAIEVGENVQVEIQTPASGRAFRLSGHAIHTVRIGGAENGELYRVQVGFGDGASALVDTPAENPGNLSIGAAVTALFDEASSNAPRNRQREGVHLCGALEEVRLPSLLGFLEMELATGILQLTCNAQKVALFIRGGRILDVESDHSGSATEALRSLLEWPDGTFEFRFQEVERDDVIEKATAWLLLDLAHQADQADETSSGG